MKKINNPEPITAVILIVTLWASYIIVPVKLGLVPAFFLFMVLSFNSKIRKIIKKFLKFFFTAFVLLSLVSAGRLIGGEPSSQILTIFLRTLGRISVVIASIIIIFSSISTKNILTYMDFIRLPRAIAYILLSVQTSLSIMNDYGRKSIMLLSIKGKLTKKYISRFNAYIRITGPVFASLNKNLSLQARSLSFRSFFKSPIEKKMPDISFDLSQFIWIFLAITVLLISFFLR